MRKSELRAGVAFGAVALLSGLLLVNAPSQAQQMLPDDAACQDLKTEDRVVKGWCTGINNRKGNCLACHRVATRDQWPAAVAPGGNVAPPLVAMQARYPDRGRLRDQLYDATRADPFSLMPPFGKHKLLSDEELDNIVEWLYTL